MAYKLRIKYGDTTIVENLTLNSTGTKTLPVASKYVNKNIILEAYNTGSYYDAGYVHTRVGNYGSSRGISFTVSKSDSTFSNDPTHTGIRPISGMTTTGSGTEPGESPTDYYFCGYTIYLETSAAYSKTATFYSDDQSAIYLNNTLLVQPSTCTNTSVTMNFVAGINKLEIIWGEENGGSVAKFTDGTCSTDSHFTYVGPYNGKILPSGRVSTVWS